MSTESLLTRIPILHKNQTDKEKFKRLFKEYLRRATDGSSEKETDQIKILTKLNPNVDNISVDQMIDDIWDDPKTVFEQKGKNFLRDLIIAAIFLAVKNTSINWLWARNDSSSVLKLFLNTSGSLLNFPVFSILYDSQHRKTHRLSTLKKKQHK